MLLDSIPMLSALRAKMSWLTQRQDVISENVANANTPGYRAKDLAQLSFRDMLQEGARVPESGRTRAGHLDMSSSRSRGADVVELETQWETTPDGNSVVLEEQMMQISQTQLEYQSAINLYRKSLDMLRTAIRSPR